MVIVFKLDFFVHFIDFLFSFFPKKSIKCNFMISSFRWLCQTLSASLNNNEATAISKKNITNKSTREMGTCVVLVSFNRKLYRKIIDDDDDNKARTNPIYFNNIYILTQTACTTHTLQSQKSQQNKRTFIARLRERSRRTAPSTYQTFNSNLFIHG